MLSTRAGQQLGGLDARERSPAVKGLNPVLKWIGIALGVVILAIQFVPVDRANPASQTQVPGSTQARAVLKKACYDCHSNEVRWPWYSRIAPVSWLVAKDVKDGRVALNFSTWNLLSAEEQSEGMQESWEKVQSGEMPLWFYLPLHPSAKLSPADRTVLQAWATSGGAATPVDTGAGTGPDTGGAGAAGTGSGTPGTSTGTGIGADTGTGIDGGTGTGVTADPGTGVTGGTTGGTDSDGDNDGSRGGGDGDDD
jgi:hypothetical protein